MHAIREMTIDDYASVVDMMRRTPGITLRDADSRESTARYLDRNPGLSFVAVADEGIAGCVLCGHDGRRGYLQHLVVQPEFRRRGVASALVERCLSSLEALGIRKSHVDVQRSNGTGADFWAKLGWKKRTDIDRFSFVRSGGDNA